MKKISGMDCISCFLTMITYLGNTFRNNGAGVAVMYSKNVRMENNHFEENWGASRLWNSVKRYFRQLYQQQYIS